MLAIALTASLFFVQSRADDRLTAAQAGEDLQALETTVRQEWSYFAARRAAKDVDLERLMADARTRAEGGLSRGEMADLLRELVAALHDGHGWVAVPGISEPVRRRLPLQLMACAEGIVVTRIVAPDTASRPDVPHVGDLVRSIGGTAIDAALAREERRVLGSTAGMRARLACQALERSPADSVALELESPDGVRRTVTVATLPAHPTPFAVSAADAVPALSWPTADIALLRIPSFAPGDWQRWLATSRESRDGLLVDARQRLDAAIDAVQERKARALILDLRGNGGGTDLLGIHLAERLLKQPFCYFRLSAKEGKVWTPPTGLDYQPRPPVFGGALVALIDADTFSTTSNFVRCLHDLHPDVTVVGRPDGAGTGAPRKLVTLPHSGAVVTLCTQRVYGPRSDLIEGVGTPPDQVVSWTRADVVRGNDPDLQEALRLLTR